MVVPPRGRSTPPASISVAGELVARWRGEADRGDRWRHPGVVGRDRERAWLLIHELLGFRLILSRMIRPTSLLAPPFFTFPPFCVLKLDLYVFSFFFSRTPNINFLHTYEFPWVANCSTSYTSHM